MDAKSGPITTHGNGKGYDPNDSSGKLIHHDEPNSSLVDLEFQLEDMATRRDNSKRFSFTRANLADDYFSEDFNPAYPPHRNANENYLPRPMYQEEYHTDNDPINFPTHYDRIEGSHATEVPEGKGLQYEIKRPEVLELFKKYYAEGSKVAEDILSTASSENFADDEDEQRKRESYRQKVESHYRRLMEEGVISPGPEQLGESWSSFHMHSPVPVSPNYQTGITESDWRAIDHHRSLSQEKPVSPSLPSAMKQSDSPRTPEKKKKKVRVRRHDSLITTDSDLNQSMQGKFVSIQPLMPPREGSFESTATDSVVEANLDWTDNQGIPFEMETKQRSVVTTRPPSLPYTRPRHVQSNTSSPRRIRTHSLSSSGRASPNSEVSNASYQSASMRSFPKRSARKGESVDDFYVQFRRREPSECSDRSSRLDPHTYQSYAAGILHSSRKSEPFLRLQKHYATLERITEIEGHTLMSNEDLGRQRYNTVSLKKLSQSLGAHPSRVEDILLSKYKLESLEELQELYADLDEAKKMEEFFYDTGNMEEIQWNPWEDQGLKTKGLTINDLYQIYERGRPAKNTHVVRRRKRKDEFKRELSFAKVYEKYAHLDKAAMEEKLIEEWWGRKSHSRRGSDASSVMSAASTVGSYIQIMEEAERKAKQRPLYGYFIKEEPNKYEIHIENIRRMSKSCPDVSSSPLHVRSQSQPQTKIQNEERSVSLPRSYSFKQSSFGQPEDKSDRFYRGKDAQKLRMIADSDSNYGEQRDVESLRVRPPSGRSSESGYDSIDGRAPRQFNEFNPKPGMDSEHVIKVGKTEFDISDIVADTRNLAIGVMNNICAYPVQWESRQAGSNDQSRPDRVAWQSEVRGVMGSGNTTNAHSSPRHDSPRNNTVPAPRDSLESERRMKIREENFRERQRWRKDSKPAPGAVATALSIFEQGQKDTKTEPPKSQKKNDAKSNYRYLQPSGYGLQQQIVREESVSPALSQRNAGNHTPETVHSQQYLSVTNNREDNVSESRLSPAAQALFSQTGPGESESSVPPERPALPSSSTYTPTSTRHFVPVEPQPDFYLSHESPRDTQRQVYRSTKTRFDEIYRSEPIPQTALNQHSTNTKLGRYEAKIRSKSVERPPRLRRAMERAKEEVDNSSLRRRDLSKSSPSLTDDYNPSRLLEPNHQRSNQGSREPSPSSRNSLKEEPIYASVPKKEERVSPFRHDQHNVSSGQHGVNSPARDHYQEQRSWPSRVSRRWEGDGAVGGQELAPYRHARSRTLQSQSLSPERLTTDDDTGEIFETSYNATSQNSLFHSGQCPIPPLSDEPQDTTFSAHSKVRLEGRPFLLAGHQQTSQASTGKENSGKAYPNLSAFRKEIEDEYRQIYDMTKKAALYDHNTDMCEPPTQNVGPRKAASTSNLSRDQGTYERDSRSLQGAWSGMNTDGGLSRKTRVPSEAYGSQDMQTGSNDTLIIKGSDPDLTYYPPCPTYNSVRHMKNTNNQLEKSQSEPNLAQEIDDYAEIQRDAKSEENVTESEVVLGHSPDFLSIRAKYESGYVSEEPSPQKDFRATRDFANARQRQHEGSQFGRNIPQRPPVEGQRQAPNGQGKSTPSTPNYKYGVVNRSQPEPKTANIGPQNAPPSNRHPWDVVRPDSPPPYDVSKNLNVIEGLGQEWERDKHKLSQKGVPNSRLSESSNPEPSIDPQNETLSRNQTQSYGSSSNTNPGHQSNTRVNPLNRPENPPPYVPPPEFKASQRSKFQPNPNPNPSSSHTYPYREPPNHNLSSQDRQQVAPYTSSASLSPSANQEAANIYSQTGAFL